MVGLHGCAALVTGAGTGSGEAAARKLARSGARVVLVGEPRSRARLTTADVK